MSGSLLSMLPNTNNILYNREFFSLQRRVSFGSIDKSVKNQSNTAIQSIDQRTESVMSFKSFERGLQRPLALQKQIDLPSVKEEFLISKAPASKLVNGSLGRQPNTSPRIVAMKRKNNVPYLPPYMQRHSVHIDATGSNLSTEMRLQNKPKHLSTREVYVSQITQVKTSICNDYDLGSEEVSTSPPCSVKDRISFFNKLAKINSTEMKSANTTVIQSSTPQAMEYSTTDQVCKSKETFISLLREKESKTPRDISMMRRVSASKPLSSSQEFNNTTMPLSPNTSKYVPNHKYNTYSLPMPLKRRPSFERTKVVASSISKSPTNSCGAKPVRHSLMEDLSLVIPVKLRIAEYERLISTQI